MTGPDKVRKNAVRALEYIITASPEAMEEMGSESARAYLYDAADWLREKHGEANILSAVIHNDETTPHLQAIVIPMDDRDRLNARAFVNGRLALAEMQTDFAQTVGEKHGLERGIEGSRVLHTSIKEHYAQINAVDGLSLEAPERRTGGFMGRGSETDEEWRQRASEGLSEALRANVGAVVRNATEALSEAVEAYTDYTRGSESFELSRKAYQSRSQQSAADITALTKLVEINQMDHGEERLDALEELAEAVGQAGLSRKTFRVVAEELVRVRKEHGIETEGKPIREVGLDDDYGL